MVYFLADKDSRDVFLKEFFFFINEETWQFTIFYKGNKNENSMLKIAWLQNLCNPIPFFLINLAKETLSLLCFEKQLLLSQSLGDLSISSNRSTNELCSKIMTSNIEASLEEKGWWRKNSMVEISESNSKSKLHNFPKDGKTISQNYIISNSYVSSIMIIFNTGITHKVSVFKQ